jgi:hypothetical protein
MRASDDPPLLGSEQQLRGAFEDGLSALLEGGGLNDFILVLANASCSPRLFDRLREPLRQRYQALYQAVRDALREGKALDETEDDVLVFLKIAAVGLEHLQLREQRKAGRWEVQFNQLRLFRPLRDAGRVQPSLHLPFDGQGFHFNKPFLRQEILWSGELLGRNLDLFYNKYPFVDLHSLLLVDRQRCLPQYLLWDVHEYVWRLTQHLSRAIPGVRVAYNALGAFASVNHLHLQLFVRQRPLPVELGDWRHNGGGDVYPVECLVFDTPDQAWSLIDRLHEHNHAYNLLYAPGRLYCFPRKRQGEFALPDWSTGFSWYELCGGMITFSREAFSALDEQRIAAGLALAHAGRP